MTVTAAEILRHGVLQPNPRNPSQQPTQADLDLFVGQCNRTGLDPLARQIYGVYRKGKLTIQVSIDGQRLVAERTEKYAGQDGPFWCGDDGEWADVWLSAEPPRAAKVVVKKVMGTVIAETSAVALRKEYALSTGLWPTKPALMLAKCAEALALRKAFPQELSGLYTAEEMPPIVPPESSTDGSQRPASEPKPGLGADPGVPAQDYISVEYAKDIVRRALDLGVATDLQLAVHARCGKEVGDMSSRGKAVTELQKLPQSDGAKLDNWLSEKQGPPA